MFSSPRQEGNVVGGHLAGGDVVTTNNIVISHQRTQIEKLWECLRKEAEQSPTATDFVEQLQHFMGVPPTEAERSLAQKLAASNRSDLTEFAEIAKERVAKKIMRFQTSAAAQDIFAYVLGELHTKYILHVRPLIATGAQRAMVDQVMEEKVVKPTADSMEPSSLGLTPDFVLAMVFYLAGNCHVRWD